MREKKAEEVSVKKWREAEKTSEKRNNERNVWRIRPRREDGGECRNNGLWRRRKDERKKKVRKN